MNISDEIKKQYWELVGLVINTTSIEEDVKQFIFDNINQMNNEQIKIITDSLKTEQKELEEISKKFDKDVLYLNTKHLEKVNLKMEKIKKDLEQEEKLEKENAEEILKKLEQE